MDYPPLKDLIEDSQELPDTKQKLFHPALIHWVKHLLAGTLPFTMILRGATILFVWWNPLRRKAYGLFLAATALMLQLRHEPRRRNHALSRSGAIRNKSADLLCSAPMHDVVRRG
jgi:hypothetical protein